MAPKQLCESLRAYADLKVTKYAKHYNIKFRHPCNFKNTNCGWDVLNWIDAIPFYSPYAKKRQSSSVVVMNWH